MTLPSSATLVTGASSGIGRAVAKRLAARSQLVLQGRDRGRLAEVREECGGAEHLIWQRNFENAHGVGADIASIVREKGIEIEHVVHCAGVAPVGHARLVTAGQVELAMNVNVLSALEIVAQLLKRPVNGLALRSAVFVSSIWGQFGAPGHVIYSATKGALDAAMRSLAVELAPRVRVNCLSLGAIETPMAARALADPQIVDRISVDYPLGLGSPEKVAATIDFLLSEDASWITGQVVTMDGGRTSHMSNK